MGILETLIEINNSNKINALNYFSNMPLEENTGNEKYGDKLFGTFGAGNVTERLNLPFERLSYYEDLLMLLKTMNATKYNNLHKGTAFYYMAWLSFDQKNYDKGLFYIDAAIAEDIKHRPDTWRQGSAIQFYTLEHSGELTTRTVDKVSEILINNINNFNQKNQNLIYLTKEEFSTRFVNTILQDNNVAKRSIISAFYVFIMEYNELYKLLNTRTAYKGSITPFIIHLFKGTVLFETILKEHYKQNDKGKAVSKLDEIFKTTQFKNDFKLNKIESFAKSFNDIIMGLEADSSISGYFSATSKLRNTTGHSVVWDDVFDDPSNYKLFFQSIVYSIFYIIVVKYVGRSI